MLVSFSARVTSFSRSPLRFEPRKIGDFVGSRREWLARRYARGTSEKDEKLSGDEETSIPLWYQDSPLPTLACGLNSRKSSLAISSTTPEDTLDFQFFFSRHRGIKVETLTIRPLNTFSSINSIIFIFRILNFQLCENPLVDEYWK